MPVAAKVAMFSTGTVQIRPEHVGPTRLPALLWLLKSRTWTSPRPINVYVIEHPRGKVVFDTGQDIASVSSADYFPRGIFGWLFARLARFEIQEDQTFEYGLAKLGLEPRDIDYAILSHLHQDHIGGLKSFIDTKTRVIADENELRAARKPGAVLEGYMRKHIFLPGLRFESPAYDRLPDGALPGFTHAWDIFGDGLVLVLQLPGHTIGSLALLVNYRRPGPVLLVGDLTYDVRLLKEKVVPGVGNKNSMLNASERVMNLMSSMDELIIAAAHDPNARMAADGEG